MAVYAHTVKIDSTFRALLFGFSAEQEDKNGSSDEVPRQIKRVSIPDVYLSPPSPKSNRLTPRQVRYKIIPTNYKQVVIK